MVSFLKGLSEERVLLIKSGRIKLPFPLKGVVRLVEASTGKTLALVLGPKTLESIEEDREASNPDFLLSLEGSRSSGRVSGREVKKKAGRS